MSSYDLATLQAVAAHAAGVQVTETAPGMPMLEVANASATARISINGGNLVAWAPVGEEPVIWLSTQAKFAPGKSIRGGVPVCWPWFGAHATEKAFPGHGFARTVPWQLVEVADEANGATRVVLEMPASVMPEAQWAHACTLRMVFRIGRSLEMDLVTTNTGATPFVLGEALHTYFQVGDVGRIAVTGLDGCGYFDKAGGGIDAVQSGAVGFAGEVDRVYKGTESECVIQDPALGRNIHVAKRGSRSTVVWNPGPEKAAQMGDLGDEGWRRMVCVESANALEDVVTVAPGAEHCMTVIYSVSR